MGAVYLVRPLFSGGPAQSQAQGDTRRNNNSGGSQLSSLESAPAVTISAPSPQGPGCSRGRVADLHSSGCQVAGASLLSCVLPASACPKGNSGSWAVSPGALGSGACGAGIVLPGRAAPSTLSRLLSHLLGCSQGPARCMLQPFIELGPRCVAYSPPGCSSSVSDLGDLGAPLPLLGSCPSSLGVAFHPGRLVKFLLLGDWAFLSWRLSPPSLSLAPQRAFPPLDVFSLFIFPSSYLDRSTNSSHCSIPAGLFKSQAEFVDFQDDLKVI